MNGSTLSLSLINERVVGNRQSFISVSRDSILSPHKIKMMKKHAILCILTVYHQDLVKNFLTEIHSQMVSNTHKSFKKKFYRQILLRRASSRKLYCA